MKEKDIINLLLITKKILEKYNLSYCLEYGTLLGAVRSGKVIPWDHDIDIAVWKKEFSSLTLRKNITKDFLKYKIPIFFFQDSLEIEKGNVSISLHFYEEIKNQVNSFEPHPKGIWGSTLYRLFLLFGAYYYGQSKLKNLFKSNNIKLKAIILINPIPVFLRNLFIRFFFYLITITHSCNIYFLRFSSSFYKDLTKIKFHNISFNSPKESKKYLELKYGDWEQPVKEFDRLEIDKTLVRIKRKRLYQIILSSFLVDEKDIIRT